MRITIPKKRGYLLAFLSVSLCLLVVTAPTFPSEENQLNLEWRSGDWWTVKVLARADHFAVENPPWIEQYELKFEVKDTATETGKTQYRIHISAISGERISFLVKELDILYDADFQLIEDGVVPLNKVFADMMLERSFFQIPRRFPEEKVPLEILSKTVYGYRVNLNGAQQFWVMDSPWWTCFENDNERLKAYLDFVSSNSEGN